jgi:hypothetical protein
MKNKDKEENDEMRPEYDFHGGIRGKYAKALQNGYTVRIHQPDGSTVVEHFKFKEGAVMLEADVREYFPDSESVNKALRSLIEIAPKRKRRTPSRQAKLREKI